ncbi:alanine racemase [Streptomyces sp. NBC_00728]|uniref:alanine racemase n=1 Tax=Streptomyces sp. NBC_00728 TaxID=2903676 RepID=UPI00386684BF
MSDTSGTSGASGDGLRAYVDLVRLDRNLAAFHRAARRHGVAVRAHAKAHRTVEIAHRQRRAGAVGIAVNQVAQARQYAAAGITDIVIAHPWNDAWRRPLFARLARRCRVSVHVDGVESALGLGAAARAAGSVLGVRIQLGTGDDVTATPDGHLLELARAVTASPALRLDGVTGYQALTSGQDAAARDAVGRDAAEYVVRCAALLRRHGFRFPTVAVGGTPTAAGAMAVTGVTEICAGAYALQDAGMAAIGVCALDEVAVSVNAGPDADALLDAYPYPWQAPGERVRRAGAEGHVLPPHICALMPGIDRVTAQEPGRPDLIWRVRNETDEPGGPEDVWQDGGNARVPERRSDGGADR